MNSLLFLAQALLYKVLFYHLFNSPPPILSSLLLPPLNSPPPLHCLQLPSSTSKISPPFFSPSSIFSTPLHSSLLLPSFQHPSSPSTISSTPLLSVYPVFHYPLLLFSPPLPLLLSLILSSALLSPIFFQPFSTPFLFSPTLFLLFSSNL